MSIPIMTFNAKLLLFISIITICLGSCSRAYNPPCVDCIESKKLEKIQQIKNLVNPSNQLVHN